MSDFDLDGPLNDFVDRTKQIRAIMVAIESVSRSAHNLTTVRPDVDLSSIGLASSNIANAMALVNLASSFEEFIREEVVQCANYLIIRYSALGEDIRQRVRNLYWQGCLESLGKKKSIFLKKPKDQLDVKMLSDVQITMRSAQSFVVGDDPSSLLPAIFSQHSRNFKPHVVDEIGRRLGIEKLIASAADSNKLRSHFGETTKSAVSDKLYVKMNEFYDRRNEIVHSLSSTTGYGVDIVIDYIEMFEATTDSIKNVLHKTLLRW